MTLVDILFLRSTEGKYRKTISVWCLILVFMLLSNQLLSQQYIADFSVAKEEVLRKIPAEFIDKARRELVIAYQHTSHGTHVSRGIYGLLDYKSGDAVLFGVSWSPAADILEFRDYALQDYAPPGVTAIDLSVDETAFIQTSRNYLDAPENATVNVVMWSWCNIDGHDAAGNYLPGMDSLISEYGPGGSKIGTGLDQREVPVTFIFMTAHANVDANVGSPTSPKEQADTITSYCDSIQQYCLDYYSIDTYDMYDNYWEDAGDDGNSASYGGNFYRDWQDSHILGEDYYTNKETPGGSIAFGAHNTQHITANRKGYAMWWILARIAGWDGDTAAVRCTLDFTPIDNWINRETVVRADVSDNDNSVVYIEFQYSPDSIDWYPLPGADSSDGRDSLALDGWGLTFLTENTPVHGTINDSSVWVRVRAYRSSGNFTEWDVSESFGIDNTSPGFSSWTSTSPLLPGPVSMLQTISDTLSGVLDDESYPLFYIRWNDSTLSDTTFSDTISGNWNGSMYHATYDVSDTLIGDTLFWRVLALDRAGNISWSEIHEAGVVQDTASEGPDYTNLRDDDDQVPGEYNFSVDISDPDGILDNPDYPRLYYRYNTPQIDENTFDGFFKIDHSTDGTYTGAITTGSEHVGDYIFWRVKAFDSNEPADSSWSAIQNGGSILSPVNHAPTDIYLDSDSIEENMPVGALIGTLFTVDENQIDTHSYELVSGPGDADNLSVQVNQNGELLSSEIYDYEIKQSYTIRLRSTDNAGDSCEKALLISILNVNEAPSVSLIEILPSSPDQNDDLLLNYVYSDPENDPESGTQIRWFKDSIHQVLLDNINPVASTNTESGEEWYSTVQPSDSLLTGAEVSSASVVISYEPPVLGCFDDTLTEAAGILTDGSWTEDYENHVDCQKLIQPEGADYIILTFTEFNTEANYDYVRVYDGASTTAPLLGSFTGTSLPAAITSSGGSLLVRFTSDYSVTAEGWRAEYTSIELMPECIDETLTDASASVDDNTGSDDYMNNADCRKLIQPVGATEITLTFTEFNLEDGNDYIRIYDGTSTTDPLLAELTGTNLPGAITSGGGNMLIHFTSNESIRAPGWAASYTSNAPSCGPCLEETFTATSGALGDNSCDEDYMNDTDCQKLIQPEGADYIILNFTEFDLEAGYDFVRVYDGTSTSDPLLGSFSGSSLPGTITSTGGSMLVHFISDYSVTADGWQAEYLSVELEPVCIDETLTEASASINDNTGDEDYMNNADCRKLIQPVRATEITLTFTEFNLENGNDYVRIYDGTSTSDPLLAELTGTTPPQPVTSGGGNMLIHFTSNESIRAPGWSASYTSNSPSCGPCLEETFTASSGVLADNSCDSDYLNDTDCQKLIQPEGADYIILTFTEFNTEANYDYVRVYDGPSTSAPLLGSYTGTSLPGAITSSGGSILVHFTSDYSVTAAGWTAEYTSGSVEPICYDETYTASAGTVDDNSGTDNYMNDAACQKLIQPPGADSISLLFTEFNLEDGNDFVWVYDGASTADPLLGVYTGTTVPYEITSSGGSMLIVFTSNEAVTAAGWSADYTSYSSTTCGPCMDETFTAPVGVLEDNSCEEDYQNNMDCRKLIQPDGASNIILTFTEFITEANYDYVRVYDGPTISSPLLGSFTGTSLPGAITSSGGSLLVRFTSDYSVTAAGWQASYEINSAICESCTDATLTEASGVIFDDTCAGNYNNNTDCRKLIQPAGADFVSLTFTAFDLESGYDFVRVYDGTSTSDPLLGTFSGSTLPGTITSSGGSMLVHFTSDYSVSAEGWTAEYVSGLADMSFGSVSEGELIMNDPDMGIPENALVIFPNPSDGKFTISLENYVEEDLILRIIDPSGKILVEKMISSDEMQIQNEVDFNDKPAGIYFIQLYNTSFRQVGKVVVY